MASLAESNPYLRDPETRARIIRNSCIDSCAVEIEDDQERAEFIAWAKAKQFPADNDGMKHHERRHSGDNAGANRNPGG